MQEDALTKSGPSHWVLQPDWTSLASSQSFSLCVVLSESGQTQWEKGHVSMKKGPDLLKKELGFKKWSRLNEMDPGLTTKENKTIQFQTNYWLIDYN